MLLSALPQAWAGIRGAQLQASAYADTRPDARPDTAGR